MPICDDRSDAQEQAICYAFSMASLLRSTSEHATHAGRVSISRPLPAAVPEASHTPVHTHTLVHTYTSTHTPVHTHTHRVEVEHTHTHSNAPPWVPVHLPGVIFAFGTTNAAMAPSLETLGAGDALLTRGDARGATSVTVRTASTTL